MLFFDEILILVKFDNPRHQPSSRSIKYDGIKILSTEELMNESFSILTTLESYGNWIDVINEFSNDLLFIDTIIKSFFYMKLNVV